ncbi:SagB/ThcOx family dehydrogenase [Bacteroidota bacterium]
MDMDSMETHRKFLKAYWWDERDTKETDKKNQIPAPLPQKPYPKNASLIDLVPHEDFTIGNFSLLEAIKRRKSHRRFIEKPLTMEELSYLLWATQGMRDDEGISNKRTVPSAGSRHPFETYLVINRVNGIKPGLYRYLPFQHKIYFLYTDTELETKVIDACRGQGFVGTGAVVFIWTVIPYRSEWQYIMVAPKMIALDAGHLCQNLYLACETIEAGTCAIGAYNQDKMDVLLDVDGKEEFVIYAAPVGKIK